MLHSALQTHQCPAVGRGHGPGGLCSQRLPRPPSAPQRHRPSELLPHSAAGMWHVMSYKKNTEFPRIMIKYKRFHIYEGSVKFKLLIIMTIIVNYFQIII